MLHYIHQLPKCILSMKFILELCKRFCNYFLMYLMILTQLKCLNFTYSFIVVNIDVNHKSNHNFRDIMNKSKPACNDNNDNIILIFVFDQLIFSFVIKQNPDVRVTIIPWRFSLYWLLCKTSLTNYASSRHKYLQPICSKRR